MFDFQQTQTQTQTQTHTHHIINAMIGDIQECDIGSLILDQENDEGSHEYKCDLTKLTHDQYIERISQMLFRLSEGNREATYEIGFMDDGYPIGLEKDMFNESIENLKQIANDADACVIKIDTKTFTRTITEENNLRKKYFYRSHVKRHAKIEHDKDSDKQIKEIRKYVAEVLIRKKNDGGNYIDIRIAVVGNVDSAKSSTIGVLTKGVLDDGNGLARAKIFNFQHEAKTGRTSSVAHHIIGFDDEGKSVNDVEIRSKSWEDIVEQSNKIITFIDLAGHEKYLKTTVRGISSTLPDYAMIMIGSNMKITNMTRQHILLCMTYSIPFFIVLSKIDICPPKIYKEQCDEIEKTLSLHILRRRALYINKQHTYDMEDGFEHVEHVDKQKQTVEDNVTFAVKNIKHKVYVPIFSISNVNGRGLAELKDFLNQLQKVRDMSDLETKPAYFIINDYFEVKGIGTIVHGLMLEGMVKKDDVLRIGTFSDGSFHNVKIRSIHKKRVPVSYAVAGDTVCFNIVPLKEDKKNLVNGMVIVHPDRNPIGITRFTAEINILNSHSTTIRVGKYQTSIHILNTRQTAKLTDVVKVYEHKKDRTTKEMIKTDVSEEYDKEKKELVLRANMKALVIWEFLFKPLYFRVGEQIVFKESKIHGIGKVIELL